MQNPDGEAGCDDLGLHESERWNHAFVQKTCDRVNLSLRLPGRGGIFQLKLKTKLEIRKHCTYSVYMTCSVITNLFESGRVLNCIRRVSHSATSLLRWDAVRRSSEIS